MTKRGVLQLITSRPARLLFRPVHFLPTPVPCPALGPIARITPHRAASLLTDHSKAVSSRAPYAVSHVPSRDMWAARVHEHGSAAAIQMEKVNIPKPPPGYHLVQNSFASVNFIDIYCRSGLYPTPSGLPFTLGKEGAGVVVACGGDGPPVEAGDLEPKALPKALGTRVAYVNVGGGSYSEFSLVKHGDCVEVPADLDLATAAAVLLQGMTALYLCQDSFPLQKGHTALVHAAAGGTGMLLTQLALHKGATVIAAVSTLKKAELVEANGVKKENILILVEDQVQDDSSSQTKSTSAKAGTGAHRLHCRSAAGASSVPFEEAVRALTRDGQGVDVAYDGVGKSTFQQSLQSVRPLGHLVSYGNASGPPPPLDVLDLMRRGGVTLQRPSLFHYIKTWQDLEQRSAECFHLASQGVFRLGVTASQQDGKSYKGCSTTGITVLPLIEAREAHRLLETRRTSGKLLLNTLNTCPDK